VGSPRHRVAVVVPAYDEAERIAETVEALRAEAPALEALDCALRILVVDDGSRDKTGQLALEHGADRVVRHARNLGLGAAVRTGLVAARAEGAELVVKFDADLQHDPRELPELLAPLLADEADLVYGSRFERLQYRMPLVRRAGNLAFTRLMRWLTGWRLRDSQPGIFALNRTYLEVFRLPGDYNYTQQLLLDAFHKGMRFAHVPVTFRERTTGRSFVSLAYPFKALPQIAMVLVGVRPMKLFAPIGLSFLALGALVFGVELGLWLLGRAAKPVEHVNFVLGTGLFGLQTLFFGILAQLIVERRE
jgi:glycosyltransferase involved in cell wall biosynthesis